MTDIKTNLNNQKNDSQINEYEIKKHLSVPYPLSFKIFDIIPSTNSYLMQNKEDLNEFTVAIAKSQTSGKGRMGRSFYSPKDTGIYMSILLKPDILPENALLITPLAAVAVCRAIEKLTSLNPKIKWVNDIFINDKKVCGILTESSVIQNKSITCVLGIGINIKEPENGFPDEIKNSAGSLFKNSENIKNKIIAEFFNEFFSYYKEIEKRNFYDEYKKRCFVLGKKISFEKSGKTHFAYANDIDENFNLCVLEDNGTKSKLYSGEISIKC